MLKLLLLLLLQLLLLQQLLLILRLLQLQQLLLLLLLLQLQQLLRHPSRLMGPERPTREVLLEALQVGRQLGGELESLAVVGGHVGQALRVGAWAGARGGVGGGVVAGDLCNKGDRG